MAGWLRHFPRSRCIKPTLARPLVLLRRVSTVRGDATRSAVRGCIAVSVFVSVAWSGRARSLARYVVMQGTCLTLVSRVTILPGCMCSRAPYREADIAASIAEYNGCCERAYALVRAKRRRRVPRRGPSGRPNKRRSRMTIRAARDAQRNS